MKELKVTSLILPQDAKASFIIIDGNNILDFKNMIYYPFNTPNPEITLYESISNIKVINTYEGVDIDFKLSSDNTSVLVPHTDGVSSPLRVRGLTVERIDNFNFRIKGLAEVRPGTAKGSYSGGQPIEVTVEIK